MRRFALLLLTLPSIATAADPDASSIRPNLVVVLADDLGYGDLGCYGHKVIRTPNLDKLADEGMRLTQCYAGLPVCSPSRAALLTGRSPYRFGVRDWIAPNLKVQLPPSEQTLPSRLRAIGYRTAHVGKWHLNSRMDGTESTPGSHGFDHWFSTQNNAAPSHQNPTNFVRNGKNVGPLTGNSSTIIVDESIRWLGESDAKKPFAMFVWFHAPHEPVAAPDEFTSQYASIDDPTVRSYYGSITLMDREVGRLLADLDKRGMRGNTLVWFTSDNGPETLNRYKGAEHSHGSPGPLRGMKLHLTEGGIRVPGIVRWPKRIEAKQTVDAPIGAVDLLPTVYALTRSSLPANRFIDGTDVSPLFDAKPVKRETPLFWQYDKALGGFTFALRDGDWKLLADKTFTNVELYNLKDDPAEKTDRAADQPERFKAMRARAEELKLRVNAGAVIRPTP